MTRIISIVGGLQPSTPTIGTATAGDTTASVAFTPSTYIGKGTITYTATSSPSGITATSATSPITVTGLSNGTAYTFTVTGTTNYGVTSLASGSSNSVTPVIGDLGFMFPIATTTVSSAGASSIIFSSIPQTYTHLQLRLLTSAPDGSTEGYLNYNADYNSGNYYYHRLFGNGGATAGGGGTSPYIFNGWQTGLSGSYVASIIDIFDYTNTNKTKVARCLTGFETNTGASNSSWIANNSTMWNNTNAISEIRIIMSSGNFAQYSQAALYGIKGA